MTPQTDLMGFLNHRISHPKDQATFQIYFWTAIVGVGGAGIWAEALPPLFNGTLHWDWTRMAPALYTFFPAIAVTSGFDLALSNKHSHVIKAFGIGSIIAVMGWALLCVFHPIPWVSAGLGIIGSVIALLLWRIANGENPMLRDQSGPSYSNPIGGLAEQPLAGNEGDYRV